jgi:ferric-dicitrate binding protein FerR (iron transport regulator)
MEKKEVNELLIRYKAGTCTADEKARLESWYDHTAKTNRWEWTESERAETEAVLRTAISSKLGHRKSSGLFKPWMKVAASLLLFLAAGTALYYTWKGSGMPEPVYAERSVPAGKKVRLILSDGTTIFLNGSSSIRYPEKFGSENREVTLIEGEAFFDVVHDEKRPFIVNSTSTSITVLGTAFNVRSYKDMSDTKVAVYRGKVSVQGTVPNVVNKQVFLLPNEQASVNKQSGDLQKNNIGSKNIAGWTGGHIVFDNESLENVAATLYYTRNITVHFAEPDIKLIRCTGGFENKDTTEEIISLLSQVNNLSYSIKNNDVYLKRK